MNDDPKLARAEARRNARLAVVEMVWVYIRRLVEAGYAPSGSVPYWKAIKAVVRDYNGGRVLTDAEVRDLLPRLVERTVWNWAKAYEAADYDAAALGDRWGSNRHRTGFFDMQPALSAFVRQLLVNDPALSASRARDMAAAEAARRDWRLPSASTFQRFVKVYRASVPQTEPRLTGWSPRSLLARHPELQELINQIQNMSPEASAMDIQERLKPLAQSRGLPVPGVDVVRQHLKYLFSVRPEKS